MATQLRLSEELMQKAEKYVKVSYRSIPKQIEFWANIGQEVETHMTAADLAALASGEIEVKVVRKKSMPVDMDTVFSKVEQDRENGTLATKVVKDQVWYEQSKEHPEYLVRVEAGSGERTLGIFKNGTFKAYEPSKRRGSQKSHK